MEKVQDVDCLKHETGKEEKNPLETTMRKAIRLSDTESISGARAERPRAMRTGGGIRLPAEAESLIN